jgi:DNA-binding protein YbaB
MRKSPDPTESQVSVPALASFLTAICEGLPAHVAKELAEESKKLVDRCNAKLRNMVVCASVPGDLIRLEAKGHPIRVTSVFVAPTLLNDADLISTYLVTAINKLLDKSKEEVKALHDECKELGEKKVKEVMGRAIAELNASNKSK